MKIFNATQVSKEHISDVFKLECVMGISKVSDNGEVLVNVWGKDLNCQFELYEAYDTDWICKTDKGWCVMTDKEYQERKQENDEI